MNKFEPTPEQWENILKEAPKPTEEEIASRPKHAESYDWNKGERQMDTGTAKVLAKEHAESDRKEAESLLERIKKGLR